MPATCSEFSGTSGSRFWMARRIKVAYCSTGVATALLTILAHRDGDSVEMVRNHCAKTLASQNLLNVCNFLFLGLGLLALYFSVLP